MYVMRRFYQTEHLKGRYFNQLDERRKAIGLDPVKSQFNSTRRKDGSKGNSEGSDCRMCYICGFSPESYPARGRMAFFNYFLMVLVWMLNFFCFLFCLWIKILWFIVSFLFGKTNASFLARIGSVLCITGLLISIYIRTLKQKPHE